MVPCPTLLTALALTIQVALDGPIGRLTECVGSALYMAPEVEQEAPYGVAADISSPSARWHTSASTTALTARTFTRG